MLLTFILIIVRVPLSPHSFIPGLKPSCSANPSHCSLLFFFRTDSLDFPDCLQILLSIGYQFFYFLVFLFFPLSSCRFRAVDLAAAFDCTLK